MILVDANIFLRYLTGGIPEQTGPAISLFEDLEQGIVQATTSEVVIHEVCFILTSRRQYGFPSQETINYMRAILKFPGWRFSTGDLTTYLRALDLWEEHPKLEFADAVIAARCEHGDLELASFDRHFDRLDHLRRWQPPVTDIPT